MLGLKVLLVKWDKSSDDYIKKKLDWPLKMMPKFLITFYIALKIFDSEYLPSTCISRCTSKGVREQWVTYSW